MRSDANEYNVMYMCDPRTPDLVKRMMIIPEQYVTSRYVQIPDLPKSATELVIDACYCVDIIIHYIIILLYWILFYYLE